MNKVFSNKVWRQIGLATLVKAAMAVLTLILFFVLTKVMSVPEYGFFGFGFSLVQVLAIAATGGFHVMIFRWVPEIREKSGPKVMQSVVRQGLRVVVVSSVVVSIVAVLSLMAFSENAGLSYAIALGSMVIAFTITEYLSSVLRAQGSIGRALIPRDIFWRGGVMLFFTAFAIFGLETSATEVLWYMSISLFGVALYQLLVVLCEQASSLSPERNVWALMRQAMPVWASSIITGTARNRDVILLGLLLDPTLVGGYFVASRIANALNLASVAANSVSGNIIAEAHYEGKHGGLALNVQKITTLTSVLTIAGALVILPLSGYILSTFGSSYITALPELVILVLTTVVAASLGPVHYILSLTGKETLDLFIVSICAVLALIIQVILILFFGGVGAAIGTACTVLLPRTCAYIVVRRHYHFDPSLASPLKKFIQKKLIGRS